MRGNRAIDLAFDKRTWQAALFLDAVMSLRRAKLGGLGLVDGSLLEHLLVLPLWALDWAADVATGGHLRALLRQARVIGQGLLSLPAPGGVESERVHVTTASRGGALATIPEQV